MKLVGKVRTVSRVSLIVYIFEKIRKTNPRPVHPHTHGHEHARGCSGAEYDGMMFPSEPAEDAIPQQRGARRTLTHPPALPNTLTDKMASENNSDSQDEKTALVERDPAQEDAQGEELQPLQSCEQRESKMTLYHWTQSFNSQKVSPRFSTTEGRTAP